MVLVCIQFCENINLSIYHKILIFTMIFKIIFILNINIFINKRKIIIHLYVIKIIFLKKMLDIQKQRILEFIDLFRHFLNIFTLIINDIQFVLCFCVILISSKRMLLNCIVYVMWKIFLFIINETQKTFL